MSPTSPTFGLAPDVKAQLLDRLGRQMANRKPGHGADLAGPSFHITLCAWSDALGGVFALRGPLGTRGIVVASPADVAAVLGARGTGETAAPKWTPAYGELNRLWGGRASLFTAGPESPTWRAVRRAVAPCFSAAASR